MAIVNIKYEVLVGVEYQLTAYFRNLTAAREYADTMSVKWNEYTQVIDANTAEIVYGYDKGKVINHTVPF